MWRAGMYGKHEDGRTWVELYSLRLNLRKNFYKDYLYYEIEPGTIFEKGDDYHSSPYLTLKLEMLFGNI